MGLSLRSIGRKITDIFDANSAEDQRKRMAAGQPRMYADQQRAMGNPGIAQRAAGAVSRGYPGAVRAVGRGVAAVTPVDEFAAGTGRLMQNTAEAIAEVPDTNPLRFVNSAVIRPYKEMESNVGRLMQGDNPSAGKPIGVQIGDRLEDVATAASTVPVGRAVSLASKGVKPLLSNVGKNVATGVKTTAPIGTAYGTSQALQQDMGWEDAAKTIAANTGLSALAGGALMGAAPVAGAGIRGGVRAIRGMVDDAPPVPRVEAKTPSAIDADYRQAQDLREKQYSQPTTQKVKNATIRNLYDPRSVEQRYDNQLFARQKARGETLPGQNELMPEQSLAVQRGKIQNPFRAAEVRNRQKFSAEAGDYSVNDLVKTYGKEGGQKARDFENYRLYKAELERVQKQGKNTLGVDEDMMANYVANYERVNPNAVAHTKAYREAMLQAVKERELAGIDAPGTYDQLAQFEFYTPRTAVDPEDLVRPRVVGGVRSGAKGTQRLAETAGGPARAPLSLGRKTNEQLERELAEQTYGTELRRRIKSGEMPGREVINADDVIVRKQLIEEARKALQPIKKNQAKAANTRADLRTSAVLKGSAEYKAAQKAKELLRKSVKDPDALAAIDGMSRRELVDSFKYLVDEGTPNVERIRTNLLKQTKNNERLVNQLDSLKTQIAKDRQEASSLNSGAAQFTQNAQRGTQTYTYKVNGETGKVEIPADLAESLAKQNDLINASPLERAVRPVGTAQKLVWTGLLQPAFKVINVAIKNPLLMYRNADGLSGIRPEAGGSIVRQLVNTKKMQQFKKDMRSRNMAYENVFQTRNVHQTSADEIAARAGIKEFFMRNPVNTMGDVWRGLNQGLATIDNAQRYAVAYGAYKRAKGLGMNEKQALDVAATAPSKVFGDFDRVSRLAQNLEVLIPYTGAIQAGTRSLIRASKTKPVSTTLKDASLLAGMTGLTAYSLGNGREYYEDMIKSGKRYMLDNNWTLILPGASKGADGKWDGVVHIPLTPDFRPANRAVWQTIHGMASGKGVDGKMIAGEIFNQVSGDSGSSLFAEEKTDFKRNLINGVLPSSPLLNVGKTLAGVSTYTGNPLADDFMQSKPRVEQATKYTSPGAKNISKATRGLVTPQQTDQILNMIGTTGDILQNKDNDTSSRTAAGSFIKPFQPGKGQTEKSVKGKNWGEDTRAVASSLKDEDDFRTFQSLTSKNSAKTVDDSAARAKELLARPNVLKAMRDLDSRARKRGETGDPFFDLTSQQQEKVLRYRGAKDLNSAKQAYDKNGMPLFTALGLDEKWYDDYKGKEDKYFAKFGGDNSEKSVLTYSGAKRPDKTPEFEAVENKYHKLPKGTGARSDYLKAHPELLAYWDSSNQFTQAERVAMGMKLSEDEEDGGSGGGGFSNYARGRGRGRGGGSDGIPNTGSAYKYAVSLKAGGSPKKYSATTKVGKGRSVKSKNQGKPKVSMKKNRA